MTIKQLSIFLENRSGTLSKVLEQIKISKIQLMAITIADTAEYGILRIICDEPTRAYEELKEAGVAVAISDVFAIELNNEPGSAADAIKIFSDGGISVAYLYSFLFNGKAVLIFRTNNTEEAREAIIKNNLKGITQEELSSWI